MKFDLKGYNIDNLLKTLYSKKVTLYNLCRPEHNHIIFEVADSDEKKVKKYINNYKSTTTLSLKRKFPKILLMNLGLVIAIFFGSIFFIFASAYTWQIRVYGTEELSEDEVLSVLSNNGVKVGKINLCSSQDIEEILLKNYDRIAQVSVIKEGTAIIINISEKLVYNAGEYEPIVAKYNGIITDINLVTGTLNVKVGDYVNVGDILVLPFNLDNTNTKIPVKPMAEIYADILVISSLSLEREETKLVRTGRETICYDYKIFNHHLFYGKNKNSFALFEIEVYNESISDLLPLSRDVLCFYELDYTIVNHNFESERDELVKASEAQAYVDLPKNVEILSQTTETTIIEDTMYATTTIKVHGVINA